MHLTTLKTNAKWCADLLGWC